MTVFDPVSLVEYLDLIEGLPLPTRRQRENFVEYVSQARSWYHCSPYPPEMISVHFFLDKHAGCARKHGTPVVTPRTERGIATDAYRAAFGYLAFDASANTVPLVVPLVGKRAGVPVPATATVSGGNVLVYGLPDEIFAAGEARLTGAVHPLSAANFWVWDENRRPDRIDWPQESGGPDTLEQIFNRCKQIRESRTWEEVPRTDFHRGSHAWSSLYLNVGDRVLHELLAPERQRQHARMIDAIDQVCELIQTLRARSPQIGP
jgi:hypothetical protein